MPWATKWRKVELPMSHLAQTVKDWQSMKLLKNGLEEGAPGVKTIRSSRVPLFIHPWILTSGV